MVTFSERVEVIRRARSLDMDPDEYTRCAQAWRGYTWGTAGTSKHALSDNPQVPRVWNEDND